MIVSLLEIRDLYQQVGIQNQDFVESVEELFLAGSDDLLPDILLKLAEGGNDAGAEKLRQRMESDLKKIREAGIKNSKNRDLLTSGSEKDLDTSVKTEIQIKIECIKLLINRLRDRRVYTLAYKLKISDFTGAHSPEHSRQKMLIELYRIPDNRQKFLRGMEARCNLLPGSLVMYCPPNARMNAKIAKVNLLIEGDVRQFDEYDTDGEDSNLTRGALWAQIRRFYELWSAQVYVDRLTWDSYSSNGKQNLRATLKEFFFQMRPDTDIEIVRKQVDVSIAAVLEESPLAARDNSAVPELDMFVDFIFPSGLPFECSK